MISSRPKAEHLPTQCYSANACSIYSAIPISTLIIYAQFYVRYKILREGVSRYVNLFTAYQKNSRWNGISPALQVFRTRHLAGRQVVVMTTLWRAKDALDGQEWFVTVLLNKLNYACTLVGLAWKCFNLKVISHYEGRNRRKALGTSVTFGECSEISTHDLSLCSSDERFNHDTIGHSQWVQTGWLFSLEYTPI